MEPTKFKLLLFITLTLFLGACTKEIHEPEIKDIGNVVDGESSVITSNTEWKDLFQGDTIDYFVRSLVQIQNDAVLTIKPGVKISFETKESGIRVEDNGALNAIGTESLPILFMSRDPGNGSWMGITFASANEKNILDFVNIRGAGSKIDAGFCDSITTIGFAKNIESKASISNSSISASNGYGIWLPSGKKTNFRCYKNTIQYCQKAAIALPSDYFGCVDSLSEFGTYGFVDIYSSIGNEISTDDTIQALKIPYRIFGKIFIKKSLTICPGSIFELFPGSEIITSNKEGTEHNGLLTAIGEINKHIVFKTSAYQPNPWVSITITSQAKNELRYCDIYNGGASKAFANPNAARANIVVGRSGKGAKATIKYCLIANSTNFGIAKYVDNVNSSNSSVVSTKNIILIPPNIILTETNTFESNANTDFGNYTD